MSRTGSDREYAGKVEGIDDVSLVLLSAGEIPRELATGRIHLGVTGTDLIHDKLPLWKDQVVSVAELGFGHADLIIAVPNAWVDVDTLDDLDATAAAFREIHGMRLRVATKYHRLVREFCVMQVSLTMLWLIAKEQLKAPLQTRQLKRLQTLPALAIRCEPIT